MPFEEAAETLWETAGLSVSPSQVRAVTEGVGEAIGQQMAQEEREAAGGQEGGAPPPEVLVTGADGAMVHTREEGWKEVKVGPVLHYRRRDKETLELASRSYVAHLGSVEEFRPKLDHEIQRRGGPGTEGTLFLGDGSPWVWEMAAEILPEAIQVLDYYHLKEHVGQAAKVLFGEESPEGEAWAHRIGEELLRKGKIEAAVEAIRGTGEDSEEAQKAREDLIRYVETHRSRMPYPVLEARGYPIGSGCVESACKQIVQKRHKQAGMRWSRAGVQRMLKVATFLRSGRWAEFWRIRQAA